MQTDLVGTYRCGDVVFCDGVIVACAEEVGVVVAGCVFCSDDVFTKDVMAGWVGVDTIDTGTGAVDLVEMDFVGVYGN